jgi:hypothetical protein
MVAESRRDAKAAILRRERAAVTIRVGTRRSAGSIGAMRPLSQCRFRRTILKSSNPRVRVLRETTVNHDSFEN